MLDVNRKVIDSLYEAWSDADEYCKQSAIESVIYTNHVKKIAGVIGEKFRHDISDYLTDIACDAEYAGFEYGFRYGVMFMSSILPRPAESRRIEGV